MHNCLRSGFSTNLKPLGLNLTRHTRLQKLPSSHEQRLPDSLHGSRRSTHPPSSRRDCLVFVVSSTLRIRMRRNASEPSLGVYRTPNQSAPFLRDYSRAITKHAIPLIVSDINGLKKPEEANLKFQMMVGAPNMVQSVLNVSSAGRGNSDITLQRW